MMLLKSCPVDGLWQGIARSDVTQLCSGGFLMPWSGLLHRLDTIAAIVPGKL